MADKKPTDTERIEWLQRNSYAMAINYENGKGFIRLSGDIKDSEDLEDDYDVRKVIDEAIERQSDV